MCTNVSMWSAVYWTTENVTECACEIETKKEEKIEKVLEYRKIASFNTSRLEAHVGFFRLLMKGIFGPYVLGPFDFLISNAVNFTIFASGVPA